MQPEWDRLIKQYRFQFSLTQADLAHRLGVSQKTVSRWESGENRPNPSQQRQFTDLLREPYSAISNALSAAVRTCPAQRALCLHENIKLLAVSKPSIVKRPSIVSWIGCDLASIACGILAEMLEDRALQRSILKGEIANIYTFSRSNLRTPEHPIVGIYRTTISFFLVDGTLFRDAISVPVPENSPLGYWPLPMDEILSA
jgi:DNA-binding XRE family transcriptional regulator